MVRLLPAFIPIVKGAGFQKGFCCTALTIACVVIVPTGLIITVGFAGVGIVSGFCFGSQGSAVFVSTWNVFSLHPSFANHFLNSIPPFRVAPLQFCGP